MSVKILWLYQLSANYAIAENAYIDFASEDPHKCPLGLGHTIITL